MSSEQGLIARHDGTQIFHVNFAMEAGDEPMRYMPVPGGVVLLDVTGSVFIPMCRLEYDLDNGRAINVHLTSTLPQMMMGAGMAAAASVMQQLGQQEDGG